MRFLFFFFFLFRISSCFLQIRSDRNFTYAVVKNRDNVLSSSILARRRRRNVRVCVLTSDNEWSIRANKRSVRTHRDTWTNVTIYLWSRNCCPLCLRRVPCEYERENFDINQQRVATITIIQRVRVPRKLSKRMFNERLYANYLFSDTA